METNGAQIPAVCRTGFARLPLTPILVRQRLRIAILSIAAITALSLSGCVTQDPTTLIGPCRGERFQECPISLGEYKPVQQRVGGQDPELAVAVAISGGGHRAGNFGMGVLLGLEQLKRDAKAGGGGGANALTEVDYLSTVSGGGLCAAAYVSSLLDYQFFGGPPEGYSLAQALADDGAKAPLARQTTDPDLRANLQYNYVDEIIRGALTIVTAGRVHRGDFLENSFDDRILGRLWRMRKLNAPPAPDLPPSAAARVLGTPLGGLRPYGDASLRLSDMFIPLEDADRPVRLPYWAANAATYENAAIFPFTPEHLRLYDIRGYTHRLVQVRRADDANAGAGEKAFAYEAPLAVGLTASGTFPVLIPACTLQSGMDRANPYLHLVDGGLADTFGAMTAIRMLRQDKAPRKVLIVIDAFNGPLTPFSKYDNAPAAVATAFRMATAFLDAWRARYHEVITALCSSRNPPTDIRVIFLSFDDLLECKDIKPLEPFGFGPDDLAALRRLRLSSAKEQSPFILARDVLTWYSLSPPEQKLLFAVGRYLVDKKKDEIRQAIGWAEPAGR
jgi:hypothetical protein